MFGRHRDLLQATVQEIIDARQGGGPPINVPLAVTSVISLVSMMSLWYRPGGRLSSAALEEQFVRQSRRILGLCD